MKYPTYPEYRESNIEWVGVIPSKWEITPAKINFNIQLGKMLQNDPYGSSDEEVSYLKAMHVNWDGIATADLPKMWASPSDVEKFNIKNGDLLVCEGGEVGRAAILENLQEPSIIQNALHRVRGTSRGSVRYFRYLLRCAADAGWFSILCNKATIAHLTGEKLGAISMPVPTLLEQQCISDFLDWKTSQADRLIVKKKELLENLKEKRIAVVTKAVTKGLDSTVPMQASGTSWLGDVPAHWQIKRLRFACKKIEQGWSPQCDNLPASEDEWGVMKVGCVNGDVFDPDENKALPFDLEPQTQYELHPKEIIISRANTRELLGSAAIVPDDVRPKLLLCDKLYRVTTDLDLDEEFLTCCLRTPAARFQYEREATGASSSMKNIGQDTIKNFVAVVPPIEEQHAIVRMIKEKTAIIDGQMERAVSAISRLTEYRTALITAATTGKIDVRNFQVPEPV